jgi:hypothetical protein
MSMDANAMVNELLACFVPPPAKMQEKMMAIAGTIHEEDRKAVMDRIIETEASSIKVSVKNIAEACRALGVGFHEQKYTPAIDWQCDACGHEFKFHQSPTMQDKIEKNIHDTCPMCGFQPGWTMTRNAYAKMGNGTISKAYAEQYMDQVQRCTEKHGPGGKGPNGELRTPYFSRHKAEEEAKGGNAVDVQAIIDKLATDRRWMPRAHA